ncbi:MAG: trehalose-phosphatase [Elusimicrobia bacterium]|nr:trehalose-phosphatase [Elusimicrobiota bacterium]
MSAMDWTSLESRLSESDFSSGNLLVGLDFDGTLAEIVDAPEKAELTAETRSLLEVLSRRSDTRVAVLSGRALDDLKARVGLPGLFYAGNHGLEVGGPRFRWTHPSAGILEPSAIESLEDELRGFPGAFIEHKQLGFAVHYRRLPSRFLKTFRSVVRARLSALQDRYRVMDGNKTFDVRSKVAWDKGHALGMIRRTLPGGWLALFAGDAGTDEEGFRTLGPRALTIRVGQVTRSSASFVLPRRRMVDRLLRLLASRSPLAGE